MRSPSRPGTVVTVDLQQWAAALAAWQLPASISQAVRESPWVLPGEVFARRAERAIAQPVGESYRLALEALGDGGSVIDVGAGGGSASLPLATRITSLTAVDSQQFMLDDLAARAARLGLTPQLLHGTWPEVADRAPVADVVLCHHVIYNVPELAPFIDALTRHARRRVVVDLTERHPLTTLNRYWLHFHGLRRPDGPTADDAVEVLRSLGLPVRVTRWVRPHTAEYSSFDQLVDVTRRRLCLPPERAGEVAAALRADGISTESPPDLGSSGREVVTVWWDPPTG